MDHAGATSLLEEFSAPGATGRPLCVKLSGALVRTDLVWESVLWLARKDPWFALALPLWMLGGKASLSRRIAERGSLAVTALPYRTELVDALRDSASKGRRIVLAATKGEPSAQAVADHLALFDEVVTNSDDGAVDGSTGRASLEARFGVGGFDYVGDSIADLPALANAERGYLIGVTRATAGRVTALGGKVRVLATRPPLGKALVKVMRPHQWAKNALVVVPLLLAAGLPSFGQLRAATLAAIAFSWCASAGYVFNDLLDVEADRLHATKHRRPFASGDLPITYGPPLFFGLLVGSFGLALATLPPAFLGMLAIYFVATMSYSLVLKSKLMVDVIVLALLYTHRVLAGGIATDIHISAWLLAFSMFMFVSLALAKRYVELRQSVSADGKLKSRGYHTHDLEMVASMGPTAGYIAVLVFCLFVDSSAVSGRYRAPMLLWFIAPLLLYWISRVWFLAHRGQMQDDPVKFALSDRLSWLCALLVTVVAGTARFWPR